MNSPRVIELPRRMEPVIGDSFLERSASGEVVALRPPRAEREPAPQPSPRRLAGYHSRGCASAWTAPAAATGAGPSRFVVV